MKKFPLVIGLSLIIAPFISLCCSEQDRLITEETPMQEALSFLFEDAELQRMILELQPLSEEQELRSEEMMLVLNENNQILHSTTTHQCSPAEHPFVTTRKQGTPHVKEQLSNQSILFYSSTFVTGLALTYLIHTHSASPRKKTVSKKSHIPQKTTSQCSPEEPSLPQTSSTSLAT